MANPASPPPAGRLRQAVIVIHGIGEQRPMATLRAFADGVLGEDRDRSGPAYYSRPDTLSDNFELRCLRTPGNTHPRTDFFEFYWAHLMPTATWRVVWNWVVLLLGRRPSDVPPRFFVVWIALWISLIATVFILGLAALGQLAPGAAAPAELKLPLAVVLLGIGLQGLFLAYVGDAATYLSPAPGNVAARHAIRTAGVGLLERLHASGEYSRIVVVGHSLGSVIGYDVLRFAWHRYNSRHGRPERPSRTALQAAEALAVLLRGQGVAESPGDRWHAAAHDVREELRANGHPWLVTDFITLGSPLAHAGLLLATNAADFERQVEQREMPVAPPVADAAGTFSVDYRYELADGTKRSTFVPHHAAWTACVRWSNLYFPSRWLLRGDAVGGPLAPYFGKGVVDLPVRTRQWGGWLTHTLYWRHDVRDDRLPNPPLRALRHVLAL